MKAYKQNIVFGVLLVSGLSLALAVAQFNPYIPPPPPPEAILPPPTAPKFYPPPRGGYSTTPTKPIIPLPPVPDELKNFPLDLDLLDFAKRNPLPKEHCFFPVKGRKKDFVEFIPDHMVGTYNFPTGTCALSNEQCFIAKRNARLPGMKKSDPPVYSPIGESSYRGSPVIPYQYVDDIDFSKCAPTWKGYFEVDDQRIGVYEKPKRDYSQQSCYHPMHAGHPELIFCDDKKCQLGPNQYCENATGKCFLNGYQLKNKKGESVAFYENLSFINWNFCTDESGRLIPEDGGARYEERFQPGCSYRINAPNFHEKRYAGQIDFVIKCDEYRCYNPVLQFDMRRKEYMNFYTRNDDIVYTKTPQFPEFLTIDWTCRDATKVSDYNKELLCTYVNIDPKAPNCRLCYENKKLVYKDCRLPFDELGRRADIPEELRHYNLYTEAEELLPIMQSLYDQADIDWEMHYWFSVFVRMIDGLASSIDLPQRLDAAVLISKFRALPEPSEKDVIKLRKKMDSYLPPVMKKNIEQDIANARKGMCHICNTSTKEAQITQEAIRETCSVCRQ